MHKASPNWLNGVKGIGIIRANTNTLHDLSFVINIHTKIKCPISLCYEWKKEHFLLAKLNNVDASYFNTLELCTVNLQCTPALGDHIHDDPFVEHLCQAYLDRESRRLGLLRRLQQCSVTYTITTPLPFGCGLNWI